MNFNFVGKPTTPQVSLQHNVYQQHRRAHQAPLNTLAVITHKYTDSNNKLTFIRPYKLVVLYWRGFWSARFKFSQQKYLWFGLEWCTLG